jgi:hypothetical protein
MVLLVGTQDRGEHYRYKGDFRLFQGNSEKYSKMASADTAPRHQLHFRMNLILID